MSNFVIGVYDSLAKAENAEMRLGEAQMPVGQISVIAEEMQAEKGHGDITARDVAAMLAASGIQLAKEKTTGYKRALNGGKYLLLFRGDAEQVTKAYHALGNTDCDELTVLDAAEAGSGLQQNQDYTR